MPNRNKEVLTMLMELFGPYLSKDNDAENDVNDKLSMHIKYISYSNAAERVSIGQACKDAVACLIIL